jgi:hypothetical protein
MRLKSAIWVAAYLRRRHIDGTLAVVRRRGAEEAGAIFIKISRLDGTADLFGPAPQSAFDEALPVGRAFCACFARQPVPEADVEAYLARQIRFDPDVWIVEVEDRDGRNMLDYVVP